MKELKFIPLGEVSEKTKIKLELMMKKMMKKRDERIQLMIDDYRNGRFAEEIKNLPKN